MYITVYNTVTEYHLQRIANDYSFTLVLIKYNSTSKTYGFMAPMDNMSDIDLVENFNHWYEFNYIPNKSHYDNEYFNMKYKPRIECLLNWQLKNKL